MLQFTYFYIVYLLNLQFSYCVLPTFFFNGSYLFTEPIVFCVHCFLNFVCVFLWFTKLL